MTKTNNPHKKLYGIDWYKGEGSQAYLLDSVTDDQVMMVKTYTTREGHCWGITTKENLINTLKKNRGLYEILLDRKRKVYFDIDSNTECLEQTTNKIIGLIPDAELAISGSVTNNGLITKYSYHIVINNYYLRNVDQCLGLKQFCKENSELGFDWKVYTKNRAMKCINQSKPDGRIQEIIKENKQTSHVISSFFPENCKDAYALFEKYEEFSDEPVVCNKIKQERRKLDFGLDIKTGSNYFIKETDLISLIPPNEEHKTSFTVAMYLHKLGYDFEDFWAWRERKCDFLNESKDTVQRKWVQKWTEISKMENKVTINTIIGILERYYPNIRKDYYERVFFDYGVPELNKTTDKQFADKSVFSNKKVDYLVFPMGSNKTGALIEYLNDKKDSKVIFLNVRRSLAQNLQSRIGDEYLHYNDLKRMKEILKTLGTDVPKKQSDIKKLVLPKIDKLITTPFSLHYNKDATDKYDILVIDEVETFHSSWLSSEIHGSNYNNNWIAFTKLINKCKKIILLDALYSHNTIRLLERLGVKREDVSISGTSFKYPEMKLINHRDNERFLQVLAEKLNANKKVYLFWPFKNGSKSSLSQRQVIDLLERSSGRKLKSIIYNADEMNEEYVRESLKDVNNAWKDLDLVVTNQCITVGVNYDAKDEFDSVFVADAQFVSMREIVQTSRRIRHLKTNEIHYTNISMFRRDTFRLDDNSHVPREYLEDILLETKGKSLNCVKWLFNRTNVLIEKKAYKKDKDFKLFFKNIISDDRYDWDAIRDIDDSDILERLFTCGAGNAEDAVMLIKHKFKELMNTTSELVLKDAWEFRTSFEKFYNIKKELKDVFVLKSNELKIGGVLDTLSKEHRGILIKHFSYRGIDYENSCDAKIFADAYNCFLGIEYYKHDRHKKAYVISETGENFENLLTRVNNCESEFLFIEDNE